MHAAVLFDCDGVLVDSEPQANRVLSGILGEHGVRMTPEECCQEFVGLNPRGVAKKLLDTRGVDLVVPLTTLAVPRFMALLEAEGLATVAGAARAVQGLLARGVPLAVGSNSPLPELLLKLRLTGLDGFFGPHVHSGDALGRSKPDPGVYLHAAEKLGVAPAGCTVIEDTPTGVTAGVRAGMCVLGFTGAHPALGHDDTLRAAGAHAVFDRMDDLETLLAESR